MSWLESPKLCVIKKVKLFRLASGGQFTLRKQRRERRGEKINMLSKPAEAFYRSPNSEPLAVGVATPSRSVWPLIAV